METQNRKQTKPGSDRNKTGTVIPGHVLKEEPSFKDEHKEDKKIPGVHAENNGGTAADEDREGIDLSDTDGLRPEDADSSRLRI